MKTVAFEDVNEDGLGPDVVAIAQYDMGGAFAEESSDSATVTPLPPLAAVYLRQADGLFITDLALNERLEMAGAGTMEGVREVIANL